MSFVHDDPAFGDLIRIVADKRRLSLGLVEKDYWGHTHSMGPPRIRFRDLVEGRHVIIQGVSLIERFSEDLDLKMDPGRVEGVPAVTNWKSEGKTATETRRAYFEALSSRLVVPGAEILLETDSADRSWRAANLRVLYRRRHEDVLGGLLRPFVLLEIGSARVVPFVLRDLSSFVHDELAEQGQFTEFDENRPGNVRSVHPLVTLIEKLDALHRRVLNESVDPATFVRHFEDAARVIAGESSLPSLPAGADIRALASEMEEERQIAGLPASSDSAFNITGDSRGESVRAAYAGIAPMFWGRRISLDEACATIRDWIRRTFE